MSNQSSNAILRAVAEAIDIPETSHKLAEKRYKLLSDWFARPESRCHGNSPHLYPQGSFRLGTVIRPLDDDGEYDLDMGCRLRTGISKATHTQKQLKDLVGAEVEAYREAQNIKEAPEEKNRCWRLKYSDQLNFHLDAVPSIPEELRRRGLIKEAMVKSGTAEALSQSVADLTGAITDRTRTNYSVISHDWLISNSEGYALWFESRMALAKPLFEKWAAAAKIEPLPSNRRKSPLQRAVQILKRHRDVMYAAKPDEKPISVIITTLAAMAYRGEVEIEDALAGILEQMGALVNPMAPHVANPVNPAEDFADKWDKAESRHLNLRANFEMWLKKAREDFARLSASESSAELERVGMKGLGITLDSRLAKEQAENNANDLKQRLLIEKAARIGIGAKTNSAGVIGTTGIANVVHKFYGSSDNTKT